MWTARWPSLWQATAALLLLLLQRRLVPHTAVAALLLELQVPAVAVLLLLPSPLPAVMHSLLVTAARGFL